MGQLSVMVIEFDEMSGMEVKLLIEPKKLKPSTYVIAATLTSTGKVTRMMQFLSRGTGTTN
jgi:hypothetical protein